MNGNLDVVYGNLEAVNDNLSPVYNSLCAMRKQQSAIIKSDMLFFKPMPQILVFSIKFYYKSRKVQW